MLKDISGNYLRMIRGREPYQGYLDTAGGFIDPGESAEEAARRECNEELGIEIQTLTYIGSFAGEYERCEITRPIINIVFEATLSLEQIARISLSDEITGIESYPLDLLPRDRLAKNILGIQTLLFP